MDGKEKTQTHFFFLCESKATDRRRKKKYTRPLLQLATISRLRTVHLNRQHTPLPIRAGQVSQNSQIQTEGLFGDMKIIWIHGTIGVFFSLMACAACIHIRWIHISWHNSDQSHGPIPKRTFSPMRT